MSEVSTTNDAPGGEVTVMLERWVARDEKASRYTDLVMDRTHDRRWNSSQALQRQGPEDPSLLCSSEPSVAMQ